MREVGARHAVAAFGIDEVRVAERQAEVRRERRTVVARSQQPDVGRRSADRLRRHAQARMLVGQRIVQPGHEVAHLVGVVLGVAPVGLAVGQHAHGALVAARRAADAEIDAAGEQRLQHAEILRHLEGAVVRQHHAARADLHMLREAGDARDQHFRRRARQRLAAVMLGQPVAVIAEAIAELGQLERVAHRVGRRAALGDGRLVENAELSSLFRARALARSGHDERDGA